MDTTTTVAAGRVAAACVVVVTSASRLHSLTDRQGHGTRTIAGYSKLYLAGHTWDTAVVSVNTSRCRTRRSA